MRARANTRTSLREPRPGGRAGPLPGQQTLNRALSLGGASAISTGLAFAALNFLGMAQLLDNISGPMSWIAVLLGGLLVLGVRALFSELNGMYRPRPASGCGWPARSTTGSP